MTVGELLSHTTAENMVLTHSTITETNDLEFSDYDFRILRDASIYSIDSLPYFWTISLSITSTSTRTKMQLCTSENTQRTFQTTTDKDGHIREALYQVKARMESIGLHIIVAIRVVDIITTCSLKHQLLTSFQKKHHFQSHSIRPVIIGVSPAISTLTSQLTVAHGSRSIVRLIPRIHIHLVV